MIKRKKLPKISPQFSKDKNNKVTSVLLKYSVYESILAEMAHLKKSIELSKKKAALKKKTTKVK